MVDFIRKADSQEIRCGTENFIQVRDKVSVVRTDAMVRESYNVSIENNVFYHLQKELDKYFISEFQGKIKFAVSKFVNSSE
ncbi:hypothetical protein [Intestinibacter sp.]